MRKLNLAKRKIRMPDETGKTIKFPVERLNLEDKVMWGCKACGHNITESMDENKTEKSKVLPLSIGNVMIYVCPNCYTLQVPEELFNEILKKSTSTIIT